jgi:sugar lactone lactonase YvrE
MRRLAWLLPLLTAVPLLAVAPQFWEVRTYDEFRRGKLANLSLTSDSELILAPRFDTVFNTEQTLIWSTAADSRGNVYLGTGHDGKIFRVNSAGQGTMIVDLPQLDVSALALDGKDVLYAATSPDGKVYRIESPAGAAEAKEFYNPGAKYIWSLAFDAQGRLLVATGDKGVIYRVTADAKGETFYDTDETHIISLALDKDGSVIAGGDPKGYVYRISPEGKGFVLYDSGMREVHAVAVGSNGIVYAAVLSGRPSFLSSPPPPPPTTTSSSPEPTVTVTVGSAEIVGQAVEVSDAATDTNTTTSRPVSRRSSADAGAQSTILEIHPDGTVNTIWRSRDEMVFSLLPRGNRLLFSTGAKGRIYSLDDSRHTTLLVESTEEQTTRLVQAGNRVYAASSNIGKLFSLADDVAASGTYESIVRDTDAVSSWGKLSWKGTNANRIQFFTRSGNTSSPDKTWSDWAPVDSNAGPTSPKARFVQWKAVLSGDRDRSPRLTSVTVPYLQQNFRPEVTAIDVLASGVALIKNQTFNANGTPSGGNDPAAARASARAGQSAPARSAPRRVNQRGAQSFQWTASDKNEDYLTYSIYYRGDGERNWRLLKQNAEDNFYTINSDTLPDGTYQLRIVASDGASNPVELALAGENDSRPFLVDNTPPAITMTQESIDKGKVRIAIEATDTTSTLNQAEISIDTGEWRPVFSKDGIIDSKAESFSYLSTTLVPGEHVIAFRIYDQNDNVGMQKLVVTIP